MKREIITTKDGSHTIVIPEISVAYHSHNGAVQESVHVFIEAGLRWYMSTNPEVPSVRIFEMGFGTGLNAYLTAREAMDKKLHIHYTAVEQFPIAAAEALLLNYAATPAEKQLFYQLHQSAWQQDVSVTKEFTLLKLQENLIHLAPQHPVDIIYFDAFAPSAQPELWTTEVFQKLHGMLNPGGALVTYCSKSIVRRAMQAAGFRVTKIPGPRGKREMVRAHPLPAEEGKGLR
jgi:tRNA U34 5-methylaminomethyl-2-thiouridine-forming methyltransferase MnmC